MPQLRVTKAVTVQEGNRPFRAFAEGEILVVGRDCSLVEAQMVVGSKCGEFDPEVERRETMEKVARATEEE